MLFLYLTLVGVLWGCTNPLMKIGSAGLKCVSGSSKIEVAMSQILYLLTNWKYMIPLLLNQLGSIVYLVVLQSSNISLCVPVANSLALLFTVVTSWILKEKELNNRVLLGIFFVISGVVFLISHELNGVK